MSISRRQLYAAGLPFGASATRRKIGGAVLCGGGGDPAPAPAPTNNSTSAPVTTNTDRRNAVQDGVGVSGDSNTTIYNDSDAVKALANAGAEIIRDAGGAVVELNKAQITANVQSWDKTLTTGAKLVDKLIDKVGAGFALGEKAIDSFQPAENKQQDTMKVGLIAAAVVAGAVFLIGKK